jgi:hypothetical protein
MSDMRRELLVLMRGVILVAGLVHVLSCCPCLRLGLSMSLCISLGLHLRLSLGLRNVHLVLHVCLDLLCVVERCRLKGHVVLLLVVLGWEVLRMLVHGVVLGRRVVIKTEIFVIIAFGIQMVIVLFIDDGRRCSEG